jgi:hypothetical protein
LQRKYRIGFLQDGSPNESSQGSVWTSSFLSGMVEWNFTQCLINRDSLQPSFSVFLAFCYLMWTSEKLNCNWKCF